MQFILDQNSGSLIRAFNFPEQITSLAGPNTASVKRGDTPSFDWLRGIPFVGPEEFDLVTPITSFRFGAKADNDFGALAYVISNLDSTPGSPTYQQFVYQKLNGTRFTDAVLTNGSATLTSATAAFSPDDEGLIISAVGIPVKTAIAAVLSPTTVVLDVPATATANGVTITLPLATVNAPGRSPTYRVNPSLDTNELNDLFVIAGVSALPASQAARYLLNLVNGAVVRQVDTGIYWRVLDATKITTAAGWDTSVALKEFVDLDAELEIRQASKITSTLTFGLRVYNDVNKGSEGLPTNATPAYPTADQILTNSALQTALASRDLDIANRVLLSQIAVPNGVASLDVNGMIPLSQYASAISGGNLGDSYPADAISGGSF